MLFNHNIEFVCNRLSWPYYKILVYDRNCRPKVSAIYSKMINASWQLPKYWKLQFRSCTIKYELLWIQFYDFSVIFCMMAFILSSTSSLKLSLFLDFHHLSIWFLIIGHFSLEIFILVFFFSKKKKDISQCVVNYKALRNALFTLKKHA